MLLAEGVAKKGHYEKGLPARQTLCTLSGDLTDGLWAGAGGQCTPIFQ